MFERGCDLDDGYLLSYGEGDPWVEHNSWGMQGKPDDAIDIIFLDF